MILSSVLFEFVQVSDRHNFPEQSGDFTSPPQSLVLLPSLTETCMGQNVSLLFLGFHRVTLDFLGHLGHHCWLDLLELSCSKEKRC